LCQFNPYYYYFSPERSSQAMVRQMEEKKRTGERLVCAPPEQPALAAFYANLTKITASFPVIRVIYTILQR
jgi:hypothetical protein